MWGTGYRFTEHFSRYRKRGPWRDMTRNSEAGGGAAPQYPGYPGMHTRVPGYPSRHVPGTRVGVLTWGADRDGMLVLLLPSTRVLSQQLCLVLHCIPCSMVHKQDNVGNTGPMKWNIGIVPEDPRSYPYSGYPGTQEPGRNSQLGIRVHSRAFLF